MYSHKKGNDKSERTAKGMKKKSHKDVKHEGLKMYHSTKKEYIVNENHQEQQLSTWSLRSTRNQRPALMINPTSMTII